ncbi:DUF4349 domain-containing protein [Myxococcus sp. K15C18031901]|uniref:DUF4349 domain-containing protein n=1 Tax=Myxococcus dinghuensis TaxID=2906761 RepID=UPI0020A74022|nr:DUF4349 domain-containing protein [Myxococcus dinghuensis]MCP3103480.1 DUF4349 domain-containing protein [Myxococcus dinghuensis]
MRLILVASLLALVGCSTARPTAASLAPELPATGSAPGSIQTGRTILRNAHIRLERSEPEQGPVEATKLAQAHGGYAQRASSESVTVRIPAARLDAFLDALPTLGEVEDKSVYAEDVTETHLDMQVRLENLKRVRERYLELLQRAVTVEDTIKVEKELERVTAEYESLKTQLERLEGQAALASVTLVFDRPTRPGPVGWVFYGLGKAVKWLFVWD